MEEETQEDYPPARRLRSRRALRRGPRKTGGQAFVLGSGVEARTRPPAGSGRWGSSPGRGRCRWTPEGGAGRVLSAPRSPCQDRRRAREDRQTAGREGERGQERDVRAAAARGAPVEI